MYLSISLSLLYLYKHFIRVIRVILNSKFVAVNTKHNDLS